MSMIMELVAVRDDTIRKLLADPPLVWKLVAPDDPELYDAARAEHGGADQELTLSDDEGEQFGLDKSWHGIHYLLTGTAWEGEPPLDLLLAGGTPIGDIDVGYGPAHTAASSRVAEAARALAALSDDSIRARFDPVAMTSAEIYPAIWDRPPAEDDTLGYVMGYLGELRSFLARTADAGMGLVISLS